MGDEMGNEIEEKEVDKFERMSRIGFDGLRSFDKVLEVETKITKKQER